MQILLTLAYDGTNYVGWQRQQNGMAVQQKVEEALSDLMCKPIIVKAASRTDAGVHALGQRAAFFADNLHVPTDKLPIVLTGLLPGDISVLSASIVSDIFNPRFDACYKTYVYQICNAPIPNPLLRRYSAFVPKALDIAAMDRACEFFIGRHDFAAFCAAGSSAKTTTREIYSCCVKKSPNGLVALTVTGNGFLYNMVRIIAGTLVYVGIGKISPEKVGSIIASKDRKQAGKTMPPEGLVLDMVSYTHWGCNGTNNFGKNAQNYSPRLPCCHFYGSY